MPNRSTVYRWAEQHEDFRELLSRARNAQAHYYFELMIEVAHDDKQDIFYDNAGEPQIDHARIQRHRLIVDTLKFAAASYGDMLLPEEQPKELKISWIENVIVDPPGDRKRPEPPRQIAYAKPVPPADIEPEDWSRLLGLMERYKRIAPSDEAITAFLDGFEDYLRQRYLVAQ